MKRSTLIPMAVFGLVAACSAKSLDIQDASVAENDRFANDPSFIMESYDLSGVGRNPSGRWGTLVSENVFISATHFGPGPAGSLVFYQTNDPSGPSITIGVGEAEQIGSTDIWIGTLETPIPVGYAIYDFATETINSEAEFILSPYYEQNAYLIGQSPNSYSTTQDVAAGRNALDGFDPSFSAIGATGPSITSDIEAEAFDVTYETALVEFDSGAPLFVDIGGELRLLGTNWYIEQDNQNVTTLNGFTYLGNYSQQIQDFIDEHAVPEPSAIAILAVGGLFLSRRRR